MRASIIRALCDLASSDDRILLLTGDLGFTVVEPFAERFPNRFINMGVAEQNMIGVATGLAEAGFIPFVYSIATFASLRPYEFIRNGPAQQVLPVRILGVGGGFEYGVSGATHHALEDVGVMRMNPGITVVAPADYGQAVAALRATWDLPGPVYYRLGKDDTNTTPGLNARFALGRTEQVRDGTDVALVTMGSIAREVVEAADVLFTEGISCAVMVVAAVSPPPADDLAAKLSGFAKVVTVEAHYTTGGVGSLVSEVLAGQGQSCRVVRCGVERGAGAVSGSESFLNEANGVSAGRIVQRVRDVVRGDGNTVG
jgi:transketolase